MLHSHRLAITLLLLLAPAVARADAPERLLPATTQLYVRWDGIEAHRASYEKSALGKTLNEDTGKFLVGVYKQIQDNLGEALTVPQLLGGVDPDKLQKLQDDVSEAPKLVPTFTRNGFILAAEVRGIQPPQAQLTLILPGAGAEPKPFLSLIRLLLAQTKLEIKETKLAPGMVHHVTIEQVQLVWWIDDKDAVVVLGTDGPEAVVKRADEKTDRLADHPQFKKLQGFKQFETAARGFLDTTSLVKFAKAQGKEASQIVDDLGLEGLQGVRFYFGFDLPADRTFIEIDMPGPRKGVLALADSKPFTLSELPPLPPDVFHVVATRLNAGAIYDTAVKSTEKVMGHFVPLAPVVVAAALKSADNAVGFDIRKDLLGSLGDTFVLYNSPTDGPVNLGMVALWRVKDEKKLKETADKLLKALGDLLGTPIKVQKAQVPRHRTVRGVGPAAGLRLPADLHHPRRLAGLQPLSAAGAGLRAAIHRRGAGLEAVGGVGSVAGEDAEGVRRCVYLRPAAVGQAGAVDCSDHRRFGPQFRAGQQVRRRRPAARRSGRRAICSRT